MTYSCAIFSRGAQTLEEAQRAKLELSSRPSSSCSPACACSTSAAAGAASRSTPRASTASTVTGVTLSAAQAELARRRVREAGLADQRRDPASPTTGGCRAPRSTRSRASAWPSTSARARSTSTRASLFDAAAAGRAAPQPCDRRARPRRRPARGPVLRPLRLPRRRAAAALARPARARTRGLPHRARRGLQGGLRESRSATGPSGWTSTSTRRARSPAPSARASGGCTCAPRGTASTAASRPSTRCARESPPERSAAWPPACGGRRGPAQALTRSPLGSNSGSRATSPATHSPKMSTSTARADLELARQVGVGDRALDRVAVAAARDAPERSRRPRRTGSLPSATERGSSSTRQRSRRLGGAGPRLRSPTPSAPAPMKPPSFRTQKPRPASYGVSSAVMSAAHTR